jgi:hypothetical protein
VLVRSPRPSQRELCSVHDGNSLLRHVYTFPQFVSNRGAQYWAKQGHNRHIYCLQLEAGALRRIRVLQQHRKLQNEKAKAAKGTSTSAEFSAWPRAAEDPEQAPQFAAQVVP